MEIPDRGQILNYEIRASWWATWIGCEPFQEWTARYFAWKVGRKYNRYVNSLPEAERVSVRRKVAGDD